MSVLRNATAVSREHGLPVPPGYGPPGAGQAIFSVSSFMDVIDVSADA